MNVLKEGDKAPAFRAEDHDGTEHSLQDYAGKWLLLYFYPKDDTEGCTTEACSFRDHIEELNGRVTIVGVSKDSVESHAAFRDKYHLPFMLLADPERKVIEAYGVSTDFAKRSSFLIDPEGIIRKIYPNVIPEEHVEEVMADLAAA